jgi:hypothetical protein
MSQITSEENKCVGRCHIKTSGAKRHRSSPSERASYSQHLNYNAMAHYCRLIFSPQGCAQLCRTGPFRGRRSKPALI